MKAKNLLTFLALVFLSSVPILAQSHVTLAYEARAIVIGEAISVDGDAIRNVPASNYPSVNQGVVFRVEKVLKGNKTLKTVRASVVYPRDYLRRTATVGEPWSVELGKKYILLLKVNGERDSCPKVSGGEYQNLSCFFVDFFDQVFLATPTEVKAFGWLTRDSIRTTRSSNGKARRRNTERIVAGKNRR